MNRVHLRLDRRVIVDGAPFRPDPDLHRWAKDWPPRYEVPSRLLTCEDCGADFPIWVTGDSIWTRLAFSARRLTLCVGCFRRRVI